MAVTTKTNRIDLRITEFNKQRIEKAAQIKNLSIAAYISSVVLKQADIDIKEHESVALDNKGAELVLKLLDSTDEPNESLIGLFK